MCKLQPVRRIRLNNVQFFATTLSPPMLHHVTTEPRSRRQKKKTICGSRRATPQLKTRPFRRDQMGSVTMYILHHFSVLAPSEPKRIPPGFSPCVSPRAHLQPPLRFSEEFLIFLRNLAFQRGPAANTSGGAPRALH